MTPTAAKYARGDFVQKIRGSKWRGKVVGFYETDNTPVGYVVKSWFETGSVQDWPEAALGPWTPPTATAADDALEKAREAYSEFYNWVSEQIAKATYAEEELGTPDPWQSLKDSMYNGIMASFRDGIDDAIDAAKAKGGG